MKRWKSKKNEIKKVIGENILRKKNEASLEVIWGRSEKRKKKKEKKVDKHDVSQLIYHVKVKKNKIKFIGWW